MVSGVARGEDFFDREKEIDKIMKTLEKENILLVAPRRFGKTSIMERIKEILEEKGETCLRFDIQYVDSPAEFIQEIIRELSKIKEKKLIGKLKKIFDSIQEIELGIVKFKREQFHEEMKNWISKGNELFDVLSETFERVYLFVDELSETIKNMIEMNKNEEAKKFLRWLRSIRQNKKNIRFILAGSTSFYRITSNLNVIHTINDLKQIKIDAFSEKDAEEFIKNFFKRRRWRYEKELGEKILRIIGVPIPYFLSVVLETIEYYKKVYKKTKIDEEFIEKIYDEKVLGDYGKGCFEYYWQKIRINYKQPYSKAVKEILKELSYNNLEKDYAYRIFVETTGIEDRESFENILYEMENDFYIRIENNKIKFYSKILKDWWRRHHA